MTKVCLEARAYGLTRHVHRRPFIARVTTMTCPHSQRSAVSPPAATVTNVFTRLKRYHTVTRPTAA